MVTLSYKYEQKTSWNKKFEVFSPILKLAHTDNDNNSFSTPHLLYYNKEDVPVNHLAHERVILGQV